MKLDWVKKVYSDGCHNAFTGLGRCKDKYYLAFRHATGHTADKSEQIIMVSDNGEDWKILHKRHFDGVAGATVDYRDSYFLPYKDQLLLYSFCTPAVAGKCKKRYSQVQVIDSKSETWPIPQIIRKDRAIWKPFILGNDFYAVGYFHRKNKEFLTDLLHSKDGLKWKKIGPVAAGGEVCIYSSGKDSLTAFVRTEIPPYPLEIFQSKKPFVKWTKLAEASQKIIQCPHVTEWNGKVIFIGRYREDYAETSDRNNPSFARHRTKIWEFKDNDLKELLELPSAGDNSYTGTVLTPDGSLLVSYYSQHECGGGIWKKEMPADIFLAKISR